MLYFNVDDGYVEGVVRGYKGSLLSSTQYLNLAQCDTLEDIKLQLSATDYGNFLANEPPPLTTSIINERCTEQLVKEFNYMRDCSVTPLSKFFDYITYSYMIDNIILLITGTLHERDTNELLDKCHPLGYFESMPALCVATTIQELYSMVIVDTPIAPYFRNCLSSADLNELNIELIRNTLYKAYIEDFYRFVTEEIGGATGEVMGEILQFEADRRSINITLNSFGTELSKDDRKKLFPTCGRLFPEGLAKLASADDADTVRAIVEQYGHYRPLFDPSAHHGTSHTLEDKFFEYEVHLNKLAFQQQYQYGIFYSWLKLKEQEIRNIVWISECVQQGQKDRIGSYVPIF
ncbi:ATP synthase subunit [Paraphysoderma sedebokerense]|nr:ATP synthase subunit [Paraphysoderma sedebokerense]